MLFHAAYSGQDDLVVEQSIFTMVGELSEDAFIGAWQDLCEQCVSLRSGFVKSDEASYVQFVLRDVNARVSVLDWRTRAAEVESALRELIQTERCCGFDLLRPPLMRVVVVRICKEKWRVVWTHHHLIIDGYSVPLLMERLERLYNRRVGESYAHLG